VNIVLEEDGTGVDEEEYFQHGLEPSSVLMLLKSDETWTGILQFVFVDLCFLYVDFISLQGQQRCKYK